MMAATITGAARAARQPRAHQHAASDAAMVAGKRGDATNAAISRSPRSRIGGLSMTMITCRAQG
jgi:hypothetical protein